MLWINFFALLCALLYLLERAMTKAVRDAISKIDFLCELVEDLSSELPDITVKDKLLSQLVDILLHCRKELCEASKPFERKVRDRKRRRKLLRRFKDVCLD